MASTETRFKVIGRNLITIANLLLANQDLCKLLIYTTRTPLSGATITDVDPLMGKNIRMIPQVPDELTEKGSYIVILLENYDVDPMNEKSKILSLRLDILCPLDEWVVDEESLRPFLIMSEIDEMLNGCQIRGIGKLRFIRAERITVSKVYSGYSVFYSNYEFN